MKHTNPTPQKLSTQAEPQKGDAVCWTWQMPDEFFHEPSLTPTPGAHGPTVRVTGIRLDDDIQRQISFCERCKQFISETIE